ncbi:SUKH-3 domain-containing protein [Streptomyces sp. NPDC050085]|uniref:SUKH-3 domain-containing protein n=1 Tax=Streptomyces sp. NPDC050085 TaxID=3365600 RepID=UPI0037A14CD3
MTQPQAGISEKAGRIAERIGWSQDRDVEQDGMRAALRLAAAAEGYGTALPVLPAARSFLRAFHGLEHQPTAPGRDVAAQGFSLDPERARFRLVRLDRLSAELRTALFPVGVTENDSVLAVGEEGQLLSIGPGGCWHLGDSGLEGIENLMSGVAPRRLRDTSHSWNVPSTTTATTAAAADGPVAAAVQAALTAIYVLHHHRVYSARSLAVTLTSLRGSGVEVARRSIPLPRGPLGEALAPVVGDAKEVLAAHADGAGCEVKVAVEVPAAHAGTPSGLVGFSARFGHVAMRAEELEACLRAGAGTHTGSVRSKVVAALQDLRGQTS